MLDHPILHLTVTVFFKLTLIRRKIQNPKRTTPKGGLYITHERKNTETKKKKKKKKEKKEHQKIPPK